MSETRILVTGALGQIGRVLVQYLVDRHGAEAVLATDLPFDCSELPCAYQSLDATDADAWKVLAKAQKFERVYHLVAVLSAKGEANPWRSWDINIQAWRNVIETVKEWPGCRVFFPSSIAAYGPPLPAQVNERQVLRPTTSYGVSKVAGELWVDYANEKFGLDIRSLRLPGVIGYQTMPGGGTTDYAVDIYHQAVRKNPFTCFLSEDTALPMIYMDDVLRGIHELMETPKETLAKAAVYDVLDPGSQKPIGIGSQVYNLDGFTVTPKQIAAEIQKHEPDFIVSYAPDFRQQIADSWPQALDGTKANQVWGWKPAFDLAATTKVMLEALQQRHSTKTKTTA